MPALRSDLKELVEHGKGQKRSSPLYSLSAWKIDYKAFISGAVRLVAIVIAGAVAPEAFGSTLTTIHGWLMSHFKWLYILVVVVIVALFLFVLFSKYGNVRLGGKDAKPSISKFTWFCLTMTSTIAVGICFYGVAEPVGMFMNPPEFMGVEAGTKEAIVPVLEYYFLHYFTLRWAMGARCASSSCTIACFPLA